MRLGRADCSGPGLRRIGRGRGFSYLDERGERITDPETLLRIRELANPPAWEDVWICSDPDGHLQATGTDTARRKQYLYHSLWRARRDREKFERALRFARALPRLRRGVNADLERDGLDRERVLACAARLLDRGLFRVGSDEYVEADGGIGLATIRKKHLTFENGTAQFDYPGKGGLRRVQSIEDRQSIEMLLRTSGPGTRRCSPQSYWQLTVKPRRRRRPAGVRSTRPSARSPKCWGTLRQSPGGHLSTRGCLTVTRRA